jgi:hypothetical protein
MPVAEVRTAVRPVDPVEVKFIEGNFTRGSSGRLILASRIAHSIGAAEGKS